MDAGEPHRALDKEAAGENRLTRLLLWLGRVPVLGTLWKRRRQLFLWLFIGFLFAILNLLMVAGMRAWWGKEWNWLTFLVSGEVGTLLRFVVIDRLVFGHRLPTWARCWRYHVANGGSMIVWYTGSNVFAFYGAPQIVDWVGLPPVVAEMLASVMAMCLSVGLSILTNFFWIWHKQDHGEEKSRA